MIEGKSSAEQKKVWTMLSRIVLALVFVALLSISGGFVVLAAWDVPVTQTPVEKALDNSNFLEKSS